jgi:LysM repeat protein
MRAEEWFEQRLSMAEITLAGARKPAFGRYLRERELFRVGAALTACLTMAVFLWGTTNLPVRAAVAGAQMPGLKLFASPSAAPSPVSTPRVSAAGVVAPLIAAPSTAPEPAPAWEAIAAPSSAAVAPSASARPAPTTAPSVAPKATPTAEHKDAGYAVQQGDTLFSIARHYGVPVQTLASANKLTEASVLHVGETLRVP